MEILFTEPLFRDLGWALIHLLWQGALVALLLAGMLALLRHYSPQTRYLVACAALLLMPLFPIITLHRLADHPAAAAVDEAGLKIDAAPNSTMQSRATIALNNAPLNAERAPVDYQQFRRGFETALPFITGLWLLGVLFQMCRFAGGFYQTQRLKTETRVMAAEWQRVLNALMAKMAISRPVALLESAIVTVPTAIGWLKPVILLPTSIITGLTSAQLESIIAHELAHIRRFDYFINLIQTGIETLLFYHPAIWWISRQIRIEREQACDDLVVAVCGDPLVYARALTKLEQLRRTTAPQLAMAANGGILMQRIRRMVTPSNQHQQPSLSVMATAFLTASLTLIGCLWAIHSQPARAAAAALPDGKKNQQEAMRTERLSPEIAALVAGDNINGENLKMRQLAIDALGDHAGTIILMNPQTGQVYTIVNQQWALRSNWSPASTIKLVTSMAGVTEKLFDPAARIRVKGKKLNLTDALAYSDNQYFSEISEHVGSAQVINYARQLGFGELTGINIDDERAGSLPATGIANRLGVFAEGVEVTPMQLGVMVSAIANGGKVVVPQVPRTAEAANQFKTQLRRTVLLPANTLDELRTGMLAAVSYGTAKGAEQQSYKVAGKTGTVATAEGGAGLFISYAPVDNPELAVIVATRGKDESGAGAAKIAGKIYREVKLR